jgi:hypothetical protein
VVPAKLVLEPSDIKPGESFLARGTGCIPGATVTLSAGGEHLGTTTADGGGSFSTRVTLHAATSSKVVVEARCGPTLRATLTVVVTSGVATPLTSLFLLLFFLCLVGFVLWRWTRGRAR